MTSKPETVLERLVRLEREATGVPWRDLTAEYAKANNDFKRTRTRGRSKWYHGNQLEGMPIHLIVRDNHYGEPINPDRLLHEFDKYDLDKVAALFWGDIRGSMTSAGISPKNRAAIVAARNSLPALLAVVEAAKLRLADWDACTQPGAAGEGCGDPTDVAAIRKALAPLEKRA